MKALIATLTVIAGGIVGCETSGNPGGATVPIGGGTGVSSTSSTTSGARASTGAGTNTTSSGTTASGNTASGASTSGTSSGTAASSSTAARPAASSTTAAAPAAPAAPAAAAPAARGASVVFYPSCSPNNAVLRVEKIAPSEATAGTPVEYEIRVTNLASCTVENVVINESIPSGFTAEPAAAGGNINLGQIGSNQTKSIKVRGTATAGQAIASCATATYTLPVCMSIPVVAPALQIVKTAPAAGTVCDTWPVKLVVTNSGTGTARGVTVRDPLPAGLKTTDGKNVVDFPAFDLGAGQSREFTFNVKADNTGNFTNTATASSGSLNVNSNTTTTAITAPKLTIDKICPTGAVRLGRAAEFSIVVTNTGNAPSNNTVLRDPIPAGASFVSATDGGALSGGAVVWNLGTLAPGASRTVKVTMNAGAGKTDNQATVQGDCAAAVSDACSISIQGVPDIGTGIEDFTGVRNIGDSHEFTYTVKNQGQVDLTNVKMVATFDAGLEYQRTDWTGGAQAAGQVVTWNLGTLPVGAQKTFKFSAIGRKADDFVVQTVTTSDQTRAVRNDEQVNYVD
jgi:uncharacterized repeat protein (TIGR01451 family)